MILIVAAAFATIASAVPAALPTPNSLDGLVGGSLYLGFLWLLEQHLGRI